MAFLLGRVVRCQRALVDRTKGAAVGLGITVGMLSDLKRNDPEGAEYFRGQFEAVRSVLKAHGLPLYVEPEDLSDSQVLSFGMHGYSGLHTLRRLAAHVMTGRPMPGPGGRDAAQDPILAALYDGEDALSLLEGPKPKDCPTFTHLLEHSDAEGYYLPVNFDAVVYAPEASKIAGGAIGSSYRLLEETEYLMHLLGVPLDLDPEDELFWSASSNQGEALEGWQRYGIESFTCSRLYHAARHSLELTSAIVFS